MQTKRKTCQQSFFALFRGKHQFFSLPNKAETGYYGDFARNETGLRRDNQSGKDIYFTVNETKPGIKRTKDKYVKTRAVFIDDDGDDKHGGVTEGFPIPPNLIVHTSPGKHHYYWLTDVMDGELTEAVLRGMAKKYNGDPATTDRTRIMRVPGFIHNGSGVEITYEVLNEEPYDWEEIIKHFPPILEKLDEDFDAPREKFSVKEAIDHILTGDEVHGARIRLAMHWANTGMPKADALATLNGYVEDAMRSGSVDSGRAMERLGNMKQAVDTAYEKVEKEMQLPKYEIEYQGVSFTKIPKIPGMLGEIADDVMKFMMYPSYEMSAAVAMHCVSVFGGGIHHLKRRTVSRKRTILAPTGRGKSIANKYYSELVRRMALKDSMFNPYVFNGGSHYAVNNIHMELVEHRVRSYITSEAGLMGKSKAGTTHETRAYLLNVIASDYTEGFEGRQLSSRSAENRKVNESLKMVYSAIPVLLSESVPDQYVDVLQSDDAFRSGDVGREEIFFIDPIKELGENDDCDISKDVLDTMFNLARHFEQTGTERGDQPSNPDKFIGCDTSAIDKDLKKLRLSCIQAENKAAQNHNYIEMAIVSRFYERVLTTTLIQAIAEAGRTNPVPIPRATVEQLRYSIEYQSALRDSLLSQTQGAGALSDPFDRCIDRVIQVAHKFGSRSKDRRESHDFESKIIRRGWLTDVLDVSKFKPMKDFINSRHNNRTAALREIVEYLEDKHILIPITNINTKLKLWRINL